MIRCGKQFLVIYSVINYGFSFLNVSSVVTSEFNVGVTPLNGFIGLNMQ